MNVYITYAKRTAIGSFLGGLAEISAPSLGGTLIKHLLEDNNLSPEVIDEVIFGQVLTGGVGQNPARQSAILGGVPVAVPALTINQVCGSGMKAVALAASAIKAGDGDIIIAGGQENMSRTMHGLYLRKGNRFGNTSLIDMMQHDGLTDAFSGVLMGVTAENIAKQFNISRQAQDELALSSCTKAAKAQLDGKFKAEIIPVEVQTVKGQNYQERSTEKLIFDQDEGIRTNTSAEKLSRLKPIFTKDGSVTAGNSSMLNDGAACLLVASELACQRYNLTPLARIASYAGCGVEPQIMGTGPVPASKMALANAGWQVRDLELVEANEAFAAQSEYVNQQMGFNPDIVNVNGGAIALGHPVGASGARIIVTLLHEMQRIKAKKGLATLCIGGGMGIAMCLELC
jgi:acetyl-CoA C-acetyltransferase